MSPPSRILQSLDSLLAHRPLRKVYFCGRRTSPPLFSYVVNFPRLELPLHGRYEMDVELDGRPVRIAPAPGTAVFAAPNCWNAPTWAKPVEILSLLFGKRQTGVSLVRARGGEQKLTAEKLAVPQALTGPAEKILSALLELHESGARYEAFPELVCGLLHAVRALLAQPNLGQGAHGRGLMEELCVFLQQNYQRTVTRESAAAEFGISPNHLSRLFKQQGFMTFHDYLAYVRVDRAKYMLKTYRMRIEEVAWQCGFADSAHFCRVFKRLTKRTPTEYRTSLLGAHAGLAAQPVPPESLPRRRPRARR